MFVSYELIFIYYDIDKFRLQVVKLFRSSVSIETACERQTFPCLHHLRSENIYRNSTSKKDRLPYIFLHIRKSGIFKSNIIQSVHFISIFIVQIYLYIQINQLI
jgi:hypothetical protein